MEVFQKDAMPTKGGKGAKGRKGHQAHEEPAVPRAAHDHEEVEEEANPEDEEVGAPPGDRDDAAAAAEDGLGEDEFGAVDVDVGNGYNSCPEIDEEADAIGFQMRGITSSMRQLRLQAVKNYRFINTPDTNCQAWVTEIEMLARLLDYNEWIRRYQAPTTTRKEGLAFHTQDRYLFELLFVQLQGDARLIATRQMARGDMSALALVAECRTRWAPIDAMRAVRLQQQFHQEPFAGSVLVSLERHQRHLDALSGASMSLRTAADDRPLIWAFLDKFTEGTYSLLRVELQRWLDDYPAADWPTFCEQLRYQHRRIHQEEARRHESAGQNPSIIAALHSGVYGDWQRKSSTDNTAAESRCICGSR